MIYRKFYTCCFTGHRPKGLPWGYNEKSELCESFKTELIKIIETFIRFGCNYFICGMALGIDMICAEIVITLKKKYKNIIFECAIPCREQSKMWKAEYRERYNKILQLADRIIYISESYSYDCMNKRNKYMVEKADILIAVWNGKPSGTFNTIKFAKEKGCKIKIIKI